MPRRAGSVSAVAALALVLGGCGTGSGDQTDDMASRCSEIVAEWAGLTADEVTSEDVSDENFLTDEALDFRGSYPGGTWACGGVRGEEDPRQVMAYPDGEYAELIYP